MRDLEAQGTREQTNTPPIVLMSGIYGYTVPPARTEELARQIPEASFRRMEELGHFPHAENPSAFASHLSWALSEITSLSQ